MSEQITKIQNFKPLSASEYVSSLYDRFKEPAQIVVEHKAMTTEQVVVKLKKHLPDGVRELVDIWYLQETEKKLYETTPTPPISVEDLILKADRFELTLTKVGSEYRAAGEVGPQL